MHWDPDTFNATEDLRLVEGILALVAIICSMKVVKRYVLKKHPTWQIRVYDEALPDKPKPPSSLLSSKFQVNIKSCKHLPPAARNAYVKNV